MSQEKLESAKNLFFIALGIDMAVTALVAITDFRAVGVLNDIRSGVATADQSTISTLEFWESFAKVMILTLIGVGLALVRWLDACYEYAKETLKATGFAQEGWKTWGWIVPFMNIFKPYQVLGEIYKAGAADYLGGEEWKKTSGSGVLLFWWIFWVIAHMIMWGIWNKAMKSGAFRDDTTLNQIIGMYYGSVAVCVISLIVAGLWFVVAGSLTRRLLNRSATAVVSVAPQVHSPAAYESVTPVVPSSPTTSSTYHATSASNAVASGAVTPTESLVVDEDAIYAAIASELKTGAADEGLWTRLFAECDGDENRTKVAYIKQRAIRMVSVERAERIRAAERDQNAADIVRQREEAMCEAARSMKVDRTKFEKILGLAGQHSRNPRMTIDEKEQLLRLAGGSFSWVDGSGKCSATFGALGQEKQFRTGDEFATWFRDEVVPYLLSIADSD